MSYVLPWGSPVGTYKDLERDQLCINSLSASVLAAEFGSATATYDLKISLLISMEQRSRHASHRFQYRLAQLSGCPSSFSGIPNTGCVHWPRRWLWQSGCPPPLETTLWGKLSPWKQWL